MSLVEIEFRQLREICRNNVHIKHQDYDMLLCFYNGHYEECDEDICPYCIKVEDDR